MRLLAKGEPVPAPLSVASLRARARLLVVSRETLSVRSAIPLQRLQAIFAGREEATEAELESISRGLDRIGHERKMLLDAADRAGVKVGLIF